MQKEIHKLEKYTKTPLPKPTDAKFEKTHEVPLHCVVTGNFFRYT